MYAVLPPGYFLIDTCPRSCHQAFFRLSYYPDFISGIEHIIALTIASSSISIFLIAHCQSPQLVFIVVSFSKHLHSSAYTLDINFIYPFGSDIFIVFFLYIFNCMAVCWSIGLSYIDDLYIHTLSEIVLCCRDYFHRNTAGWETRYLPAPIGLRSSIST